LTGSEFHRHKANRAGAFTGIGDVFRIANPNGFKSTPQIIVTQINLLTTVLKVVESNYGNGGGVAVRPEMGTTTTPPPDSITTGLEFNLGRVGFSRSDVPSWKQPGP
jgi:hypothetical protein